MSFLNCFSHKLSTREDRKLKLSEDFHSTGTATYNGLADPNLHLEEVSDIECKRTAELSGFDTAREHEKSLPTAMAELATPQQKGGRFSGKQHDPSLQFVKELPARPDYRKEITSLIHLGMDDEGLPQHLVAYINDHGHSLTSLFALNKAVQDLRSTDLSMWASRYNLFVLWSADRQHPWDGLPDAERIAATLEIGKAEGEDKATVLLNGVPVTSWDFCRGVFTTRDPVVWETPTGKEVKVNLSLNFGTFFGYTQEDGEEITAVDNASQSYLGTECHGVMWTADTELPHGWPVAPPIVAGKVNIATRAAALSPGATDPLSHFEGTYVTHYLPNPQGKKYASQGPELCIAQVDGRTEVFCDGERVEAWAFNPNNVLSWEDVVGNTAWLLFMPLPEGAILMGNVLNKEERAHPPSFSIFGELKDQPSRLTPDEVMSSVIGKKVATGLHVAATLLLGEVLDTTYRIWGSNPPQYSPPQNGGSHHSLACKPLLQHKLKTIEKVEDLTSTFSNTFLTTQEDGTLEINHKMVPSLADAVLQKLGDALAQQQVASNSAQNAERDACETEDADKLKNVALATYKASSASVRSLEAAEAAAEAEKLATEAASLATKAGTALAFSNALSTAQAFNGARHLALQASQAEKRAANAALRQVEAGISYHAQLKNFDKLREVASASSIACKVLTLATTAAEGWVENTTTSRLNALQAARKAAEEAQECHKSTRRMQPVQQNMDSISYESPMKSRSRPLNGVL